MTISRRELVAAGTSSLLVGSANASAQVIAAPSSGYGTQDTPSVSENAVFLRGDSVFRTPQAYAELLSQLARQNPEIADSYGAGGAVEDLENEFVKMTGKEKAIYLPTGTMANQLAAKLLSGQKPKILVQDIAHYYRDEAHAAQRVHGRRLVPVKKGAAQYTLEELKETIASENSKEVFPGQFGAIVIENPVRRANGEIFDLNEIRRISSFAQQNDIRMHLDGARLFFASTYSDVPIKEYARYFDTVYISLYKYLGASSGAILCGPTEIIDQIPELMKVHGGVMAESWTNAAVALHGLSTIEQRLSSAKTKFTDFSNTINTATPLNIKSFEKGSNVFKLYPGDIDAEKFQSYLAEQNIVVGGMNEENFIPIKMNETFLLTPNDKLSEAFKRAHLHASS
ncbi:MAG: aminotransferase class I/II-fold pyridoxal phosphate-dependent enzyme [Pseudomonadota bacterium]